MANDKLQRWALAAEIIGGIAIVISLIFVGYQVRQSTKEAALNRRAVEMATYQSLMESINDLSDPLIHDAEFVAVWEKVKNNEALSDIEGTRARNYCSVTFRHGDMAFYHYRRGGIDEESLNSVLEIVVGRINQFSYLREMWDNVKGRRFSKGYIDFVDARLFEVEQPGDLPNPPTNSK